MNRWIAIIFTGVLLVSSLSLAAEWQIKLVDSDGEVGRSNSIALDSNELPAISYYKDVSKDLKYAYQVGSSWNVDTVVIGNDAGFFSSLAIDQHDGPHICYIESSSSDLIYSHRQGSSWTVENLIDTGSLGFKSKMIVDPTGYPYIGYTLYTASTRSNRLNCYYKDASGWHTRIVISIRCGDFDMLMDFSKYIYVAFIDESTNYLRYGLNNTTGGTTYETIDSSGDFLVGPSIARDEYYGLHVVYGNTTDSTICYAYDSGSGWETENVETGIYPSSIMDIAIDSMYRPHIIYGNAIDYKLKYAWKDASDIWNISTIPASGTVGIYHSLVLDSSDRPHIAFYESTGKNLHYAYLSDATPTPTPTPTSGTPGPTATPDCTKLGCKIDMPSHDFGPGDPCHCLINICNPDGVTYANIPIFVILDVYGDFFFAPEFNDFSCYTQDIHPGTTPLQVLPEFPWPSGTGNVENILWYAGMTNSGMTELFGELDTFTFGWHE
ncbi:hypothetical protein K8T06_10160 [bacterium]|nr:hypothetical protein [bacterium]